MARLHIAIWPGSGSFYPGDTPFGLYDSDSIFQADAEKVSVFAAKKLGYPITDIEMQDNQFFACFEEATTEYGAQVNQFRIRETMLDVKGYSTGSSLTGKEINATLGPQIAIAENYGTEAGSGGNVTYKSGSIDLVKDKQDYNLQALWATDNEDGKRLVVTRVFFESTPAISRFFDPYVGTGLGSQNMLEGFGFGGMSPGINFLLMPVYADVLRIQAIEFNDQIRKSAFSFQLRNNDLRLFPRPSNTGGKVWFEYYVESDRNNPLRSNDHSAIPGGGVISDYSNVPLTHLSYKEINSVGKQWIWKYAAALSKELLGAIRSKYASIPIPNSEVTLDGSTLKSEAASEKEYLLTQLRETLEATGRHKQLEMKREETENLQLTLNRVPLKIYIG
tara:strand:+ start:343 stop:1515 length:1173 start_codon:yes stop_codon:yes gene_type:complete